VFSVVDLVVVVVVVVFVVFIVVVVVVVVAVVVVVIIFSFSSSLLSESSLVVLSFVLLLGDGDQQRDVHKHGKQQKWQFEHLSQYLQNLQASASLQGHLAQNLQ